MPKGGYRKPTNPASVSGPGALSQRTDGNPTQAAKYMAGGKYGEGQDLLNLQRQAPMAAAPASAMTAATQMPAQPARKPVSTLFEPTSNPDIPVTHGSPYGPGAGMEALGSFSGPSLYTAVSNLANYDPSGESEALANIILNKGL